MSFVLTSGDYGKGASVYGGKSYQTGAGGGSGGYSSAYVTVVPGTAYTIVVGARGTTTKNTSIGYESTAATSGFCIIAYGGDI